MVSKLSVVDLQSFLAAKGISEEVTNKLKGKCKSGYSTIRKHMHLVRMTFIRGVA